MSAPKKSVDEASLDEMLQNEFDFLASAKERVKDGNGSVKEVFPLHDSVQYLGAKMVWVSGPRAKDSDIAIAIANIKDLVEAGAELDKYTVEFKVTEKMRNGRPRKLEYILFAPKRAAHKRISL